MLTAKQAIYNQQQKWAAGHGIPFDTDGYTQTVEANLFQPLGTESRTEFESGSGDELGSKGRRGKMQALHSSSALVCNVFDYWRNQLLRDQSLATLTAALGAPLLIQKVQFERIYRTGLGGTPPHLDVALVKEGSKPFLIESKFTEPYQAHSTGNAFAKSYFPSSVGLWERHGLTECEALARGINAGEAHFSRLNAPQLLKHILGVANKFQKDFMLLYLWYDCSSPEATEHRAEVETFMQRLNGEIDFRAMTYQELFKKMQSASAVDGSYIAYLAERYFS